MSKNTVLQILSSFCISWESFSTDMEEIPSAIKDVVTLAMINIHKRNPQEFQKAKKEIKTHTLNCWKCLAFWEWWHVAKKIDNPSAHIVKLILSTMKTHFNKPIKSRGICYSQVYCILSTKACFWTACNSTISKST